MASSDSDYEVVDKIDKVNLNSDNEEADEEEEEDEVYVVEKIIGHRKNKGLLEFHIKWDGYPDSENTWEKEDDILDKTLVKKYWDDQEAEKAEKASKKVSRSSMAKTSTTSVSSAKSESPVGNNKRRRTDMASAAAEVNGVEYDADGPKVDDWEPLIKEIETMDRTDKDKLVVFITWKNGKHSCHPAEVAYQKCPQLMLQFYEERLRFRSK